MGVSLRSTSLKFPFEPFDAERPANSDVVSARAMSMASLASKGKNSLANATAVGSKTYFLMVFEHKIPLQKRRNKYIKFSKPDP